MKQVARNLLDPVDGFLREASCLVHDRDPVFTEAWTALLETHGVKCVPIPAQSPNCNPHAERFVKTVRTECLDHFVIFGERHLRHLVKEFMRHYLTERYHQGISGASGPVVPEAAVQSIGERHFVFLPVKNNEGSFVLREVRLGPAADGHYSVLEGLRLQEEVVTEGSFILKAESVRQHPELH